MRRIACLLTVAALGVSTGCASMNKTEQGALIGTGAGTAAGAIVGHQFGERGVGAVIGAATGLAAGALLGKAEEAEDERDAALAREYATQAAWAAEQNALSNTDVIAMCQNGLAESIVIASIRSRGGRFDTRPEALIQLKAHGVGEAVIHEMLNTPAPAATVAAPVYVEPTVKETVVVRESPSVIVAPRPILGPRPRRVVIPRRRRW